MSDNHDMLIHFLKHGGDILTHEQLHNYGMTVEEGLKDESYEYPNHDSYPNFYVSKTQNYRRDDVSYTLNGGSCSSPRGISYNEYGGTLHFVEGERPTLNIPMVFELMEKIAQQLWYDFDMKLAGRINYTIETWHSASLMRDGMTLGGSAADSKRSAIAKYGADALHTTTKTIIVRFLDENGETSCACDNGKLRVQLYEFRNRYYKITCPVCNGSGRRVPEAMKLRTVDDAVRRQTDGKQLNVPDFIDARQQTDSTERREERTVKQVMDNNLIYISQHAPMRCACGSLIENDKSLFSNYTNRTYGCIECADKKPAVLKELSQ